MDPVIVEIIDDAFAGFEGEVVSMDGDKVSVRVSVFGRETPAVLRRDQLADSDDADHGAGHEAVARLRNRVAEQHERLVGMRRLDYFIERVDLPEDGLDAEWDAYVAHGAGVDAHVEQLTATALDRFDAEVASLPAGEALARIEGDRELWLPAGAAVERMRARYPDLEGPDPDNDDVRLLAMINGETIVPSRAVLARKRRARARAAADLRDYTVWKASTRTTQQRAQDRLDALARVERERAAVENRFARDWGIQLPDSIVRFWAFLLACGPMEWEALDVFELRPCGIMDLFNAPDCPTRDGIDVRVHYRYYRDPPEFLTFMHGGTDGLHFGLWYDDGRTCTGVASYFNNDGGGVGLPARTPLEAVREELEWYWTHSDDPGYLGEDDDESRPYSTWLAGRRHRIRLLRELLVAFETGDRPETGEQYRATGQPERAFFEHGHPDRIETLDGGGALVAGDTAIARNRQKNYDDHEFCSNLQTELTEDAAALEARVAEARRRCAAGNPADALTLGRDLHWISAGNVTLERHANELLVMAYRALERPNLAAIAEAHHRHRDLPQVDVLQRSENGGGFGHWSRI